MNAKEAKSVIAAANKLADRMETFEREMEDVRTMQGESEDLDFEVRPTVVNGRAKIRGSDGGSGSDGSDSALGFEVPATI